MQLENILLKNSRLKNIHAGKRCFLIGNGPSINGQDITLLKNEISIVVNSFFSHPDVKLINPPYWLIADPFYWENGDKWFIPMFKDAYEKETATKLFVPTGGYSYFSDFHLGPLIDLHYFHYDFSRDHSKQISFSEGLPPYGQNVMIVALMLAFHLGCNPIYFIGCDHDFFKFTEETYESDYMYHFYADTPEEKETMKNKAMPWLEWKQCMDMTKKQYEYLSEYAYLNGYQIFNATRGGYLETFPRVEYESLFTGCTPDSLPSEVKNPSWLCQSAIERIKEEDHGSALILLEEAIKNNINCLQRVEGLEYLKALCLTRLGKPREALLWARQDYTCNPQNRHNVTPLISSLEAMQQ